MFGNFPINDDWIFVRQVEAFNQGIFTLSAELDPSFVAQGFLGLLWGKVFGISFSSLQALTFLITLIGLVFFIKILKLFALKNSIVVVSALLLFFNPLIFTHSFTFMTDNYFLSFMIISVYFFLKFLRDKESLRYLVLSAMFLILSTLTRQIGVLIGVAMVVALVYDLLKENVKKVDRRHILSFAIIILFSLFGMLVTLLWPRFGGNRTFILLEQVKERLQTLMLSLHYFPILLFPLFYGFKTKLFQNKKYRRLISVLFLSFAIFLYKFDFFPVGSVLYLEELHLKSDYRANFSLFDNIFFKLVLSLILSYSLVVFVRLFLRGRSYYKRLSLTSGDVFLAVLGLINFGVFLISSDFYDRYLLPPFICFFILFLIKFCNQIRVNKFVILGTSLLIFITVSLQWEYYSVNNLKWAQARALSEETGYLSQIHLNDTYRKHVMTLKKNDFTGLISTSSSNEKCHVQNYTIDSDSLLLRKIQDLEDYIDENIVKKPRPYKARKKRGIPRAKNNLDKLIYNEQYFSFLYDLVGKDAFVASWCVD